MQNWNDGKAQEYKNRNLYDILHSDWDKAKSHASLVKISGEDVEIQPVQKTEALLFTTSTCPNCRIAREMLNESGASYEVIDADAHPDMVQKYGIRQAPTLIVNDGEHMKKYVNASNIQKYVEQYSI